MVTWDAVGVGDGPAPGPAVRVNGEGGTRTLREVQNSQGTGKRPARETGSYRPPWKAGFELLLSLALGTE